MNRQNGYNPKREIGQRDRLTGAEWNRRAQDATYGGNPEHKSRPADYNLDPETCPRPGKSLCDADAPFLRKEAVRLLRSGFRKGMTSVRHDGDWPQNVWSVRDGEPYEAQLENRDKGAYHGYPMPADDEFREQVLSEWRVRAR